MQIMSLSPSGHPMDDLDQLTHSVHYEGFGQLALQQQSDLMSRIAT